MQPFGDIPFRPVGSVIILVGGSSGRRRSLRRWHRGTEKAAMWGEMDSQTLDDVTVKDERQHPLSCQSSWISMLDPAVPDTEAVSSPDRMWKASRDPPFFMGSVPCPLAHPSFREQ